MDNNIFKGLITAIITPFKGEGLDFASLEKIIENQINADVKAIVVAGSTGEGNSLTNSEYRSLIQATMDIAKKRLAVIASCTSICSNFSVHMALECQKVAVDGLICAVPPYIKPPQEGIFQHFKAIHDAVELPIMLYSVPSRTGVDFTDETIIRLAELPRILALKDADRDLERPLRLSVKLKNKLNLLSGNDEVALAYNAQGGVGCVSAAANVAPKFCSQLQEQWQKGKIKQALKIQQQLLPLYEILFAETNPIPVKYAAHIIGLCSPEIRLPLIEATNSTKVKIEKLISNYS